MCLFVCLLERVVEMEDVKGEGNGWDFNKGLAGKDERGMGVLGLGLGLGCCRVGSDIGGWNGWSWYDAATGG